MSLPNIFKRFSGDNKAEAYVSVDYYQLPETKDEEFTLIFPDYSKFVSQIYDTKEEIMADNSMRLQKFLSEHSMPWIYLCNYL